MLSGRCLPAERYRTISPVIELASTRVVQKEKSLRACRMRVRKDDGRLVRSADPRILPTDGHAVEVAAISDVSTAVEAEFK